jgi:hypothetical protein
MDKLANIKNVKGLSTKKNMV